MVIFIIVVVKVVIMTGAFAGDLNNYYRNISEVSARDLTRAFPTTRVINLSKYEPSGRLIKVSESNITVYETGSFMSNKVLILIYDLFGLDSHFQFIADNLSDNSTNFSVVIPDFFRGNPYLKKNWPPRNPQSVTNFINWNGWTRTVKNDLRSIFKYYQSKHSVESFGVFGYCWGGKMAVNVASDPEFSPKCRESTCNGSINVRAIGLVHPSLLSDDFRCQQNQSTDHCFAKYPFVQELSVYKDQTHASKSDLQTCHMDSQELLVIGLDPMWGKG